MMTHQKCLSNKVGKPCIFMTAKYGCIFANKTCLETIDKCVGCNQIEILETGSYCKAYADPPAHWLSGTCNFASHIVKESQIEKKTLDPRKAAKQKKKKG